ncbi:hypothetical protein C1H46_029900 [Malus baccata]|uniref:Uncharacterized protein n=1 Tax=Malus baccata TaxID=106549 RepID=A0A540LDK5_MALBA|nr:hypothetical protein C1H46_029900 [Malus baccata]
MNETLAAKDAALAVLAANPVVPEPDQESLVDPDPFAVTFRDLDSAPEVTYEAALGVMTKVEYVEVLAANVDVDADAKKATVVNLVYESIQDSDPDPSFEKPQQMDQDPCKRFWI